MLIDLDRFRSVNDTLGHLAGDRLLLQIAERLKLALPRGAEVARLGGDEFAVLLPVADSTTSASRIARGLVSDLGSPLDLDGLTLVLEASAGCRRLPDHALDAEGMLRRADVAMYQAKRDRTGVEVYESKRDSNTPDRLGLLGDLRRALDAHEVELHYQPKVRFDGQVAGLEALVRWVHPERGKVPPDEFIAIAESSGLMPHLTEYVLETALGQVARWRAQGLYVPVAVNVSPATCTPRVSCGSVAARLARHGVPAGALQLEITEHVLLEDPQRAADTLNALTGHGVKMSLDDFGTGYSSLVHLQPAPRERAEDRPLLRGPAGRRHRGRRDRALHGRPRPFAGAAGGGRGRRGRRDLGAPARPGLRRRPGLAGGRGDAPGGDDGLAAGPRLTRLAAPRGGPPGSRVRRVAGPSVRASPGRRAEPFHGYAAPHPRIGPNHTLTHSTPEERCMPGITREEVAHLARLARLELKPEELEHFAGQLDDIIGAVARVSEVADQDVPPTSHPLPLTNVMRADEVRPSLTPEQALSGAPAQEQQRFKVPQILGED